ncbi:hypothetical protein FRB95_009230 [Tulasnella sp. JGI-2019a]|nr:hypothetical protein FRB95_009230 [Tulasnella sp. JGI-2019a]
MSYDSATTKRSVHFDFDEQPSAWEQIIRDHVGSTGTAPMPRSMNLSPNRTLKRSPAQRRDPRAGVQHQLSDTLDYRSSGVNIQGGPSDLGCSPSEDVDSEPTLRHTAMRAVQGPTFNTDNNMPTRPKIVRSKFGVDDSVVISPTTFIPERLQGAVADVGFHASSPQIVAGNHQVHPEAMNSGSPSPWVSSLSVPERSVALRDRFAPHGTDIPGSGSVFDGPQVPARRIPPFGVSIPSQVHRQAATGSKIGLPLRSALRSHSDMNLRRTATLSRGPSSRLEEGGVRAERGVFANLIKLYGLTTHRNASHSAMGLSTTNGSRSRASSLDSSFPTARTFGASRTSSMATDAEDEALDPDDPRVTGIKGNRIDDEKHAGETFVTLAPLTPKKKRTASIKYHICSVLARQTFILRLAKALMLFGAPSHRLESQLKATAVVLEIEAEFVHMPSIVIVSFGDIDTKTSQTHFVKVNAGLALGRLHNIHNTYRQVVHDEIGVEEATTELNRLMKAKPIFGFFPRVILSALCTGLICPLAFGGSIIDTAVAAGEGVILAYLQLGIASKNSLYSNVFEISVAILFSFIARGLSSIRSKIFCYSAISSAGVVLVLPGYMILCSALELASKNIVGGSVKLTFAIVYSLFIGFGLTIGSDLYFVLDPAARAAQAEAAANYASVVVHGSFVADNATSAAVFAGSFVFSNTTGPVNVAEPSGGSCFRDPNWPWYLQPFPLWSLGILVPAFSIFSSAANGQPFRSKQLPVMVFISCASFAANDAASRFIFNRSDVVSAIGAFVVGILGNLYSRITKTGTSFTSMVTGVLFLVPSGIAATGGLSGTYSGTGRDQYSDGLLLGLRMVQVSIGITVGLFTSSLVIYSFGRSKRGAIFAF